MYDDNLPNSNQYIKITIIVEVVFLESSYESLKMLLKIQVAKRFNQHAIFFNNVN